MVLGAALVTWMLVDSFETLLATSLRTGRWSFTRRYYGTVWKATRAVAVRLRSDDRREQLLSRFGPASFLGLLVAWTLVEILGWGLIWWGLRAGFGDAVASLSDALYYSGVVYFSIGFGDILPVTGPLRALTILAGLSGLGTLGLVIGFLPSLNAAYSARERQLLLLDDLTDGRVTPVTLAMAQLGPDGDMERLDAMFDEWSAWCAETYDSHSSFPMLMWFRSKHRGNSWITALGVVTDAAIAVIATVPDTDHGAAMRLYRQSVRLVSGLGERVELQPHASTGAISDRWWAVGYDIMRSTGVQVRPFEESHRSLTELRAEFHPWMEAFIDELVAPRGFWAVTSADHLAAAHVDDLLGTPDDPRDPTEG